eukprot:16619-Heterococcus_DN1.PRE.2
MASGQNTVGSAAASKFSLVDPLGGAGDDDEKSIQQAVTEEVNNRMGKAVDDLKDKYDRGGKGFDASHDNQLRIEVLLLLHGLPMHWLKIAMPTRIALSQPTGQAYQRAREEKQKRIAATRAHNDAINEAAAADEHELQQQLDAEKADLDSDDEYLDGLDDDPELEKIRQARMSQLKQTHEARAENLAKGHGQYREIAQDEFLPEVTGSSRVVAHFYHNDFQRCKVNAEKAPFFVQKLQVKVLPCLIIFRDGISVAQIQGFEGLNEGQAVGTEDEWPTGNLAKRLALANAIDYTAADTMDQLRKAQTSGMIREGFGRDADYSDED